MADEPADAAPDTTPAERYEQLRSRVLHGQADGWRLGLGVLAGRGMVAWIRAWTTCTPTLRAPALATAAAPGPPAGSPAAELVRVLAAMALAHT